MPWKNGGGVTSELARSPQADEFDWRLSVAEVATDGPFSQFPGIDRLLVLLSGADAGQLIARAARRAMPRSRTVRATATPSRSTISRVSAPRTT